MENILANGKRVLAVSLAATTILWALGLAAFAMPQTASAASGGDLIVGESLSTVYYYAYDGTRYTFPNEKTFMTWYENFDDVETITDSALSEISLTGNVVYRPGSRWIKIDTDPKTYAVSTDGAIHWIETEDVATDFAGEDWSDFIDDVPDVFFADYTDGASLMSATAYDGMMYMDGTYYYLAWGGEKRMVSTTGRSSNRMQDRFFLDGDSIEDSALTAGDDLTAQECEIVDVAQTGCSGLVVGGELTVALASDTPASMTVPDAASGVKVTTWALTADEATTLSSLSLHLSGLATNSDIASNGVYIYEGNERLTDGRTVNSSTKKSTFAGLNLDFADGETRYLSAVVDMGDNGANRTFAFEIASADDVDTDGSVGGSFPVTGNTHTIIDLAVGEVTITETGSLSNPLLGETDATVAKFKLDNTGTEDIEIEYITLNIDNASDHSNYQLWQGSTEVATATYIGDDKILFEYDTPFDLAEGADRDFYVTLDVGGNVSDTIDTWLDNDADLHAIGQEYGFAVAVDRPDYDGGDATGTEASGSCAASTSDCSKVTIQGGDVTVAFNGPAADDVKIGADAFDFMDFSITSQRWATVEALELSLTGTDLETSSSYALTDIRIVDADDGTLLAGPQELASTANTQELDYTDNFVLEANTALNASVTANVNNTTGVVAADDTFTFTIDMSEFTIEDINGDAITNIVPTADIEGNAFTAVAASLTVSLASTPSGESTYVKGATGVPVASFSFEAGTGSSAEVTDVTFYVLVDADADDTFADATETDTAAVNSWERISSCSIYDDADDSLIDGPESPATTTGHIVFDNFSWDIDAGDAEQMNLLCNVANVDTDAGGTSDQFAFAIDTVADDVSALDDDGDAVAASAATTGLNETPDTTISVVDNGTLSVTLSSGTPVDDFLITGSTMTQTSEFRFDAAYEPFTVNRLTVTEEQGEDDVGTENSNRYANNISKVYITYPLEDGSEETKSGSLTGNEKTFDGIAFFIDQDDHGEVAVYVDADASDRGTGSATSNERVRMGLSANSSGSEFRALGEGSGETINEDSTEGSSSQTFEDHFAGETSFGGSDLDTISGDAGLGIFRVRETAPTITISSSTPMGSGFVPGDQEVLRFNVYANSNEDVVIKEMVFSMSSSDNASSDWNYCDDAGSGTGEITETDFDLYNLAVGTGTALDVATDWVLYDSTGAGCTDTTEETRYVGLSLTTPLTIAAGATYTYALYFDSYGASSSNDDSIQFLLAGDPIVTDFLASSALAEDNVTGIDTTLTVASGAGYTAGDILCMDTADDGCGSTDERMLLAAVSGASLTVVRGYMATAVDTSSANDTGDDVDRLPGALLWQDDGTSALTTAAQEYYGAHNVSDLPLVENNAMSF